MLAIGKTLTAEQRMMKASTDIVGNLDYVAIAGVLMIGSKRVDEKIPTACTNGRDETYGRAFVDGLTDPEFRFVMLHECYHKMYKHLITWKNLHDIDHTRANRACDYVINLKLVDQDNGRGWIKMPKGGLLDEKYRGMNVKQVFDMLSPSDQEGGEGGSGGSGSGGGFDDHDWEGAQDLSPEEAEELGKQIDEALRQGSTLAGKMGSGGLRDMGELLQPKKDWRELLREFVTTTCSGKDYSTWRRPNRRFVGMDMIMPSSVSEAMNEIVIAIDTSGSIGAQELSNFLGEVAGIAEQVKPNKARILYWDTSVCRNEVYLQSEVADMAKSTKPAGGGGTDVNCVIDYMNQKEIKPECVVVLTDGYLGGSWGKWSVPVLWCIVDNKNAKPTCGVAVHIQS